MATKAKTKKKSAASRYASQVEAESTLKFGPEASSLAQALKETDTQYQGDVSVARGTRRAIEEASKTAKPKLQKDFGTSQSMVQDVKGTLAADLAKLPQAGALAGASARDAAGTERRLAETLAMAKSETTQRAADAASGESFAIQAARQRRSAGREKITDRATAMAQEQGAFAQGRTGELVEGARERSVTRRGQDISAEQQTADRRTSNKNADADRDLEREKIDAEKKGKDKPKTPDNHENARTAISQARHEAQRLRTEGKADPGRSGVAATLVNGRPDQTVEDADGTKIKIPGVKAAKQELFASVALDMEYDGHVSTANMKKLQKMGYSVKDLGLETAGRSGTKKPPQPLVPKPKKPTRSKPNALSGTTLGGFPARGK